MWWGLDQAHQGDLVPAGLADGGFHGESGRYLTESPVTGDQGRVGPLFKNPGLLLRGELAGPDGFHVSGDVPYAVGVDSSEVGQHQVLGNPPRRWTGRRRRLTGFGR